VTVFIQSYGNDNLHIPTLYTLICKHFHMLQAHMIHTNEIHNIMLLQIKQLVGLNKKYYNFWTFHLPTSSTHIIMTTNQVHAQI
jgi:hypothetical protein